MTKQTISFSMKSLPSWVRTMSRKETRFRVNLTAREVEQWLEMIDQYDQNRTYTGGALELDKTLAEDKELTIEFHYIAQNEEIENPVSEEAETED